MIDRFVELIFRKFKWQLPTCSEHSALFVCYVLERYLNSYHVHQRLLEKTDLGLRIKSSSVSDVAAVVLPLMQFQSLKKSSSEIAGLVVYSNKAKVELAWKLANSAIILSVSVSSSIER